MEGSRPAVPAEPGTLKTSLVAMPGSFAYWFVYMYCVLNVSIGEDQLLSMRKRHFSLSLRRDAHGPLAKHLMHMAHLSGNTSGVSKSSSDWLNYAGFQGDVCVTFFIVLPGNKDAVAPNPLTKEESLCLQL